MYHSHLPFSPRASIFVHGHYLRDHAGEAKVLIGFNDSWSPDIRSVHTDRQVDVLEYSHDGSILAAGAGDTVLVFQAATGERIAQFRSDMGRIVTYTSLTFSADDRILSAAQYPYTFVFGYDSFRNCIALWDIATGTKLIVLPLIHRAPICTITFSPKNSQLLHTVYRRGWSYCSMDH